MIDKVAKKTHNLFSFLLKRMHHEIATQINLIRVLFKKNLKQTMTKKIEKILISQYRFESESSLSKYIYETI